MSIRNSGIANNGVSIRSIVAALAVYAFAVISIHNGSRGDATVPLVIYMLVVIGITIAICKKEINAIESNSNKFKKNFPFSVYGLNFGDFQHVFYSENNITTEIEGEIESQLKNKTPIEDIEKTSIVDIDKGIDKKDSRDFMKATSAKTERGTSLTLIIQSSNYGNMRSVRWWVVVGGYVDYNKYFNFVAYSPLLFPFWIVSYLKKDFDVLGKLRTIYSSSYNDFDISTYIRCLHETVFCAMVDTLEKHDIDTAELRIQKAQVMNLNVSGGKVNIGNVVQGAMNKVTSAVRSAKS